VEGLANHYSHGGRGTESLAIQWIISHLKPGGQSFVIVPDGLLNQIPILDYIKAECNVLAVVALPSRTFYSTPKKTYILGLRKKESARAQTDSVFTYLVSEIGESRDTRRVAIPANDLTTMEQEFRYFRSSPNFYSSSDARCRIITWRDFSELRNWLVDRNWSHEEKVALGIVEEIFEVDADTFRGLVGDAKAALDILYEELA
jgi:type I restriction enzyme M protein